MPTFRTWLTVRRRIIAPIFVVAFFLVIFFAQAGLFRTLQFFQKPLVASGTWVSNQYHSVFGSCAVKPDEYNRLVSERNQYAIERSEMERLRTENATLTKELGFLQQRQLSAVPASIISRTVSNQTATFLVNVGALNHIVVGSAVIVEDGMFVGKVTRVDQTQSMVTASTDFQLATGVSLLNKTRTIGIAQGTAGNLIELKFIPADEEIHPNDLVITSGLEDHVPSGLIVGVVNTVKPEPEAPFQRAIVEPLSDVRRYNHVVILVPTL
ncbi:MAG: rod shape-determining protein MreC [Candidatus Uhrbacteria bacterium]|nr:rod shape-determining protein MreC [Candidatus Uhrbacteria bacterium]